METKWLHDFIALSEQGSFSRAAESRFVTQPAFSRRIRSLENWLGVALVCRNRYPLELTPPARPFWSRRASCWPRFMEYAASCAKASSTRRG
ncbi:LysR family transcriptional regulator [Oceanimonas sp. NS1]|nr:LysR family transcriptional regulator [Oceanimonas sp. NS1]